ncbi:hypothetical protein ACFL35_09520 [Candidatus Riflebacteria bacterium]
MKAKWGVGDYSGRPGIFGLKIIYFLFFIFMAILSASNLIRVQKNGVATFFAITIFAILLLLFIKRRIDLFENDGVGEKLTAPENEDYLAILPSPFIFYYFFWTAYGFYLNYLVTILALKAAKKIVTKDFTPGFYLVLAILIAICDLWSVYFGPTSWLLDSENLTYFIYLIPVPFEGQIAGIMGYVDSLFLAIFMLACQKIHTISLQKFFYTCLLATLVFIWTSFYFVIPLPLMLAYSPIYLCYAFRRKDLEKRHLKLLFTGIVFFIIFTCIWNFFHPAPSP